MKFNYILTTLVLVTYGSWIQALEPGEAGNIQRQVVDAQEDENQPNYAARPGEAAGAQHPVNPAFEARLINADRERAEAARLAVNEITETGTHPMLHVQRLCKLLPALLIILAMALQALETALKE
jgi:hypothetical protein